MQQQVDKDTSRPRNVMLPINPIAFSGRDSPLHEGMFVLLMFRQNIGRKSVDINVLKVLRHGQTVVGVSFD